MMLMGSKVKTSPPAIMAEWMFHDPNKKAMVLFPVFAIWGIIFGVVVSLGNFSSYIKTGLGFALIPWAVLNIIMLPMAGAGLFGHKRWNMIWVMSLIMHLIWGVIAGLFFGFLVSITA